jgi:hypothetical protein
MNAELVKRLAESIFGRKNTSGYAVFYTALILLAISWLPDGIADLIDYNWSWQCWFSCSYKLMVSIAIFILFAWQLNRAGREDDKLDVHKKSPKEVKALGIFLSTIGKDKELINKEIRRIESSLQDNTVSIETFFDKQWEMPLIAINYHKKRLETLYVFTSEGDMGSSELMYIFRQVIERLYPSLRVREVKPKGINYEDVKQVFNEVEFFYANAKNDGYAEHDIIVDVTGGQKPNTIAASIATLISGREFQYISTGTKEVFAYDVWYIEQVTS